MGTGYLPPTTPGGLDRFTSPFVTQPYQVREFLYDGSPVAKPQASAADLNRVIAATIARDNASVTVVGLSKGAQVATASMHRSDASASDDVEYVLIGNPDRDGGLNTAVGLRPHYGEVRHNVIEVYGEYDGIADWPDRFNPLAMANATMGIVYVHTQYGAGSADDPLTHLDDAVVTVEDNLDADGKPNGTTTTTKRVPTTHLPLTRPLRDTMLTFNLDTGLVDDIDTVLRPVIDLGYSRNDRGSGNKFEPQTKAEPAPSKSRSKVDVEADEESTVSDAEIDGDTDAEADDSSAQAA